MTRVALIALLAACATERASVTLEQFPIEAFDALCDWAVRCRHVPDRETCARTVDPRDFDIRRAADAIAAGRLSWDANAAAACVAAQRDQACLTQRFADEACREMTVGLVPPGGGCTSDFECAGGTCEGNSCDEQCCEGTCVAARPAGTLRECDSHDDCADDEHCGFDGQCAPLPDEEGEECVFGCAWGDLYCDISTATCRRFAPLGEPCGASAPCDEAWSYCAADAVCRVLPILGEACAGAPRCVGGSWCDGELCRVRGNGGEPCATAVECEIACVDAVCVAYKTCPEVTAP